MKTINSKRRFYITGLDRGIPVHFTYFLGEFLDEGNNFEIAYAMQESLDAILDLKVGQALTMHSNRDHRTDDNIIIVYRNQ
jgi:hypothetical protein